MRDQRASHHATSALQRLLDPLHADGLGEAKRQIKRLTADELHELALQLLVLYRIVQEVEQIEPTEVDRTVDHKVPDLRYFDRAGFPMRGGARNHSRESR